MDEVYSTRNQQHTTSARETDNRGALVALLMSRPRWVPLVAVAAFVTVWHRTLNFAPSERVLVRVAAAGQPRPSSQPPPPLPPPHLSPAASPPSPVASPPSVAPWRLGRPVLVFSGGQEGDRSMLRPNSPWRLSSPLLLGRRGLFGSARSAASKNPPTLSFQRQATESSESQPSAVPQKGAAGIRRGTAVCGGQRQHRPSHETLDRRWPNLVGAQEGGRRHAALVCGRWRRRRDDPGQPGAALRAAQVRVTVRVRVRVR